MCRSPDGSSWFNRPPSEFLDTGGRETSRLARPPPPAKPLDRRRPQEPRESDGAEDAEANSRGGKHACAREEHPGQRRRKRTHRKTDAQLVPMKTEDKVIVGPKVALRATRVDPAVVLRGEWRGSALERSRADQGQLTC